MLWIQGVAGGSAVCASKQIPRLQQWAEIELWIIWAMQLQFRATTSVSFLGRCSLQWQTL